MQQTRFVADDERIYIYIYRGTIVIVVENEHFEKIKILIEAACIPYSANTLGKSMHTTILSAIVGKYQDRLDF